MQHRLGWTVYLSRRLLCEGHFHYNVQIFPLKGNCFIITISSSKTVTTAFVTASTHWDDLCASTFATSSVTSESSWTTSFLFLDTAKVLHRLPGRILEIATDASSSSACWATADVAFSVNHNGRSPDASSCSSSSSTLSPPVWHRVTHQEQKIICNHE